MEKLVLYKDIVCKLEKMEKTKYLLPKMLYKTFKQIFGDNADVPSTDVYNSRLKEEDIIELKLKAESYGFIEIDGELKIVVYGSEDFTRTNYDKKNYGVSYGVFELKEYNEVIYACETLTGFADIPEYIQLTKNEYDCYIEKINGNENVTLPHIDKNNRIFCNRYRNSGKNYFTYNDVFHEEYSKNNSSQNKI